MSQYKNLDDEFKPIKSYSVEDVKNDPFISRLQAERKFQRQKKLNYAFNIRLKPPQTYTPQPTTLPDSSQKEAQRQQQRTLNDQSTNDQKSALSSNQDAVQSADSVVPKPKRRIFLMGKEQLNEYLEDKKRRKESRPESVTPKKKRHLLLIPMDEAYKAKALAAIGQKHDDFDPSQPIPVSDADEQGENSPEVKSSSEEADFHDVLLDTPENYHQIVVSDTDIESGAENDMAAREHLPQNESESVSPSSVLAMKKTVLPQLIGYEYSQLEKSTLHEPYKALYTLFDRVISDSENHSTLLVGPPGSGKTLIVEWAIRELHKIHKDRFITIRLSGSLHGNEAQAIREIARQLDRKLGGATTDRFATYEQRAISDTFNNILLTLNKSDSGESDGNQVSVSILFVIDEIEKFTDSHRQTLLYNLLELCQTTKVPMCILGVTSKLTVRELFEKRVRSRFSQRLVVTKRPSSLQEFWGNIKLSLQVPQAKFDSFETPQYPERWNRYIDELFSSRSGLQRLVYHAYYSTKSYKQVLQACMLPVSSITAQVPLPDSEKFEASIKNSTEGIESVLASLSRLELMLVIAAARWIAKSNTPQVNYKMAYDEYSKMVKAANVEATTLSSKSSYIDNMSLAGIKITQAVYSAKVLRDCWGKLYRTGVLFDVISNHNETNAHNSLNMYKETVLDDSKMLQLDTTLDELGSAIADAGLRRFTKL